MRNNPSGLLTHEEVDAAIDVAEGVAEKALLAALWETGAALDELVDASYVDGRLHIPGNRERSLELKGKAREFVEETAGPEGGLWDLEPDEARETVRGAAEEAGLEDVGPEEFRESRARILSRISGEEERARVLSETMGRGGDVDRDRLLGEEELQRILSGVGRGTRETAIELWSQEFSLRDLTRETRESLTVELTAAAVEAGIEKRVTPEILVYSGYDTEVSPKAEETLNRMGWEVEE